jgi:TonB family protein
MPISEAPADVNEPKGPAEPNPLSDSPAEDLPAPAPVSARKSGPLLGLGLDLHSSLSSNLDSSREPTPYLPFPLIPEPEEPRSPAGRASRWADYNTHELLQMISELEDERRWARLREGTLWAILVHLAILLALFLLPRYIKVPNVVESSRNKDQEFTYLDTPFLKPPKPVPPLTRPLLDKQTMDWMKKQAPPAPPPPEQKPEVQEQPKPQPEPVTPPNPQSQSQVEAPRPAAVPAKPNFAMGSQNPADQLRDDMQKAMRGPGQPNYGSQGGPGLRMHPGAGTGGIEVLSDTQGVDFNSWLQRWHYITQMTWDPLIPDEVNPPILKQGIVAVRFKVLPSGQVIEMQLDGRSGDTGLDRAAWGAITGSSYPPLPREFHGPYLELRAYFLYNEEPR